MMIADVTKPTKYGEIELTCLRPTLEKKIQSILAPLRFASFSIFPSSRRFFRWFFFRSGSAIHIFVALICLVFMLMDRITHQENCSMRFFFAAAATTARPPYDGLYHRISSAASSSVIIPSRTKFAATIGRQWTQQ